MQPPPPPLPQVAVGDQVLPEKAMHPTNIRRAALALEAHAHTMPPQRREHLSVSPDSPVVHCTVHGVHTVHSVIQVYAMLTKCQSTFWCSCVN